MWNRLPGPPRTPCFLAPWLAFSASSLVMGEAPCVRRGPALPVVPKGLWGPLSLLHFLVGKLRNNHLTGSL